MVKHWGQLINTDCKVIKINDSWIYPIFRNGSTSLCDVKDRLCINEEIKECDNIQVLIRDPKVRFISGVNQYCRLNKVEVQQTWSEIAQNILIDRHFAPQAMWLLHLYKFYKGKVTLRPFSDIGAFTQRHTQVFPTEKIQVDILDQFVNVDYTLLRLFGRAVDLKDIVEETADALS